MKPTRFLSKLSQVIPGYRGYATRETRRNDDKLLRDSIVAGLFRSQSKLESLLGQQLRGDTTDEYEKTEELIVILKSLMVKVRYAPYGESGLLSNCPILEDDLIAIHSIDTNLLDKAKELQDEIELSASMETIKNIVIKIEAIVATRTDFLRERK